jgi:rhodanese-related sulfurtransferase
VLLESGLLLALGLGFALVANGVSPRGLSLTRNYFPGARRPSARTAAGAKAATAAGATNLTNQSSSDAVAARLREQGLNPIDRQEALQLFRDPQYEQELIVFVDGRDDEHYQAGHVPGAYQLDHYYPERYLPTVLPACQTAQRIVVYCEGGDCEEGEFTALTLKGAGLPPERLWVYFGGMADWATNGLPVELGARKSGNLQTAKP